jgi:glutathione S-transferase
MGKPLFSSTKTILTKTKLQDYQFIPNGQKARNLLHACGIPYQCCLQPFMRPRPALTDLGITYRRMPINSINKDFYCDNKIFLDAIQSIFPDRALPTSAADSAWEAFGYRSFWVAMPIIPAILITPEVAKDREDLFAMVNRPDLAGLRPNSLGELGSVLDLLEREGLVPGPWIGGEKCGVADIHAIWVVKWAFETLQIGLEPGFSRDDFPRVYSWIGGLPPHDAENDAAKISLEDAHEKVLSSDYAAKEIGVDSDATGLQYGMIVNVTTTDE